MNTTIATSSCSALFLLALAGCDGATRSETRTFSDSIETVERIDVETGAGDIEIHAVPGLDEIRVEAVIHGEDTRVSGGVLDGELSLSHECPSHASNCAVDWYLSIPAREHGLDLVLDTGAGDILVSELIGNVWAETGSGDLILSEVSADYIKLETGSGELQVVASTAKDLVGHSGSGDLDVELGAAPLRASLETGSGDARLAVPGGGYRVVLTTGSGTIDASGIEQDSAAERSLKVVTGSGDIDLIGR